MKPELWAPRPELAQAVADACEALSDNEAIVTFAAVAAIVGATRRTLYRYPELRLQVERARALTRSPDGVPPGAVQAIGAALQSLSAEGARTSVSAVARRSGVSRSTIYRHTELLQQISNGPTPGPVAEPA